MPGPTFRNPPAVERVLSVQFRELAGFDLVHYGMWYERIRDEFPLSIRQAPLSPIIEQFPALPGQHTIKFGLEVGVPLGRCVYSSAQPSTRLQQLQPDRFAMNWRRQEGDDYVRFSETSQKFAKSFQEFTTFCRDVDLPEPIVELCEVKYVNRIAWPDGIDQADFFTQVFGNVMLGRSEDWLPTPSKFAVNRLYDFPEEKGRLYAEANSAEDSKGEFLRLEMTGRTVMRNDDHWQDRMSLAHDWVVNGFVAITQEAVRQNNWEQYDD